MKKLTDTNVFLMIKKSALILMIFALMVSTFIFPIDADYVEVWGEVGQIRVTLLDSVYQYTESDFTEIDIEKVEQNEKQLDIYVKEKTKDATDTAMEKVKDILDGKYSDIIQEYKVLYVYSDNHDSVIREGDVNRDGKVNLTDVSLMLKYIAKWDVTIIYYIADINGDDKVNLNDVTLVLQKIAGWDMPGIPANEFIQKLADDYTKYMEKEYNHDTEKNGIFRVSRYYGTYGNAACVMIIGTGMDYHCAFWSETVAGSTIHYNYGNSIIVCVNGEIFSMTEAYENGYLTTEQVAKIAEINNKGKYIEYSIGF
ncbi:MAG: hypothetical protein E7578_05920 [Ruminococcaceae bacterium]|nr:hypothetical protein [Oscillospiraceae bacterium]